MSVGECEGRCRSAQHTSQLASALTSSPELPALVWCYRHCTTPGSAKDTSGRSLLHVAAGTGYKKILRWLLDWRCGQLNGKDLESGYSPLHRAVFHGELSTVVMLIKLGANMSLLDHDGLTALEQTVLDRPLHLSYDRTAPLDAYVWGTNSNYNLGLGTNTNRAQPDLVETFRRETVNICQVSLQKFHSAFVTRGGEVMTCGHGRGGRLGHGAETMQLTPRPVQLAGRCLEVALGVDHSVFLMEGGTVLTCGMNTYHQLGHAPPPTRLLSPAPVSTRGASQQKLPSARGVAAARFHSVFFSSDSVYTWGLNAGQLGHMKGQTSVILPKLVSSLSGRDNKISSVVVSDGATVVLTSRGDVVALYEYGSKKLGQRQHNVLRLAVTGGSLDPGSCPGDSSDDIDFKLVAGGGEDLKVVLLSITGRISVWEESRENNFLACKLNVSREVMVKDLALHKTGLVLVSEGGEAWQGTHQPASGKHKHDVIKVKRINNIHRAVAVSCDAKGRNYCVLQVCPNEALTELPEVSPSELRNQMKTLLEDVNETDDLHDVVCLVGKKKKRFPAHGFVLASGSERFAKLLLYAEDEEPVLDVTDIEPDIFTQILQYLYYRTCDMMIEGPCPVKIEKQPRSPDMNSIEFNGNPKQVSAFSAYAENKNRKKNSNNKIDAEVVASTPILRLQEAAKFLGVFGLSKMMDCYRLIDGNIVRKTSPPTPKLGYCSQNFPELQDVTIICEDKEEVFAHKCVLVSRSEYFFSMFSSGWSESSAQMSLPLPASTVQTVIDYLYTDESVRVQKSEDLEFVCNILVVADQFLLSRLKQICESQLTKLLTLKNVTELLQFSVNFLADQLERTTMQFICLNLPAILESRSLELLDDEAFDRLDVYYKNSNPVFRNRRLGPISSYPSRDLVLREYEEEPLSLEELISAEESCRQAQKSRPRRHSSGDKRPEKRVETRRLNSTTSTSESDNESEPGDKLPLSNLCLQDFEIEEREEVEVETPSPVKEDKKQDKSYFEQLLSQSPVTTDSNKNERRKPAGRISQKERKRLSLEAAATTSKEPESSPAKLWTGWGNNNGQQSPEGSSLADIMRLERQSPPQTSDRPKFGKKTSWKKIELGTEIKSPELTPTKLNPWNLPPSPQKDVSFLEINSNQAMKESFQEIVREDIVKEENLVKVKSKSLNITQIEEKAIEELRKFYNVDHCQDEVITISRQPRGTIAAPIWRKKKN